jgi:PKD domain
MLRRLAVFAMVLAGGLVAPAGASALMDPVAALSGPASFPAGVEVTFDASSSTHDPGARIVRYQWDIDGSGHFAIDTGSSAILRRSFPAPSDLTVAVRVTDDHGQHSTATGHFQVVDPSAAPGSETPTGGGSSGGTSTTGSGGGKGGSAAGGAPAAGTELAAFGGDPALGVAALTRGYDQWITVGSTKHFAAINGAVRRSVRTVRSRGLWVNLLADRATTFRFGVYVSRAQAKKLGLRGLHLHGMVRIAKLTARLATGGQRAQRLTLPRAVRQTLQGRVTLVVKGAAVAPDGSTTAVTRAFALR